MGMVAILLHAAEPFEQIVNTLLIEGSIWNLEKTDQAVSEKKTSKDYFDFIHVYSPWGRAETPWDTLIIHCKFQQLVLENIFICGCKFDLAVKRSKVNLWSSFEQIT